jgi:hypothetical protein
MHFFGNSWFRTAMADIEVLSSRASEAAASGAAAHSQGSVLTQSSFPKSPKNLGEKPSIPTGPDCGSLVQVGNGRIVAVAILAKETISSGQHSKVNID